MKSEITRRDFLKISGGSAGLLATSGLFRGPLEPFVDSSIKAVASRWGHETTTICPFCSCGCGFICYTDGHTLVRVEGDPEHPVNHGAACPRGAAMAQLRNGAKDGSINEKRLQKVLYRAPGSTQWEEKNWDFALERIAQRIKDTRDFNWTATNAGGWPVNRTEAIASLGGASLNNEECYLISKMMRSLGVVYLEHDGRDQSSAFSGLASSFGYGAMSNHWTDISNADCVLIIGLNNAENHPASFIHVKAAQDKGAKIISVDPRLTRTAARADIFCPLRPGTDIAFIGGLIKFVIDDITANPGSYNLSYITEYTNAARLVDGSFKGPADLEGHFSGYSEASGVYEKSSWSYQTGSTGLPRMDRTLKDPNCVFQILRKHFARYTPELVSATTGTPVDTLLEVCRTFAATGAKGKAGTILCSTGATQHLNGTQIIRSFAILQLLLGNVGIAGGGVNAISVEANAQGASDHGLLSDVLPGYLKVPIDKDTVLERYTARIDRHNIGIAIPALGKDELNSIVSLLKTWYGDAASLDNDFAYANLPRIDQDGKYTSPALFDAMSTGQVKGLIAWGQNPAVSSPNAGVARQSLERLEWLVVTDLFETETAAFWKRPGSDPGSIRTEVFLLPTACSFEKEGSVTNAGRWMQWRNKAVNPPGESRADLDIINQLMVRLKALYTASGGPNAQSIIDLTWGYEGAGEVAKEINGRDLTADRLLGSSVDLNSNGGTACGNRLYCGSFTETGNLAARRDKAPGGFFINLFPRWGWSWPNNERILYNRASVDLDGQPWDDKRAVIEWDSFNKQWKGDVPQDKRAPDGQPFPTTEGRGLLFAASLEDGPLPEHYEPWESPVINAFSAVQNSPSLKEWPGAYKGDATEYPLIATTFSIGEHCGSGQMTRNMPWLLEMTPEAYIEIGPELGMIKQIKSGDMVTVKSARGQVTMKAMVTKRLLSFNIAGKTFYQVALPCHWGYMGLGTGGSGNLLTPNVRGSNSAAPELKAFLCDIFRED